MTIDDALLEFYGEASKHFKEHGTIGIETTDDGMTNIGHGYLISQEEAVRLIDEAIDYLGVV